MEGLPDFLYNPIHPFYTTVGVFVGIGFSIYFMLFLRKLSKGRPIRLGKLGKMAKLDKLGKSWQSWRKKRMKSLGRIPSLGRMEKLSSLQKDYPPNYKHLVSFGNTKEN